MPANNGLRIDDRQGLPNIRKHLSKPDEYQPVEAVEPECLWGVAAQHDDLLPQHYDFGLQSCSRSQWPDEQQPNQSAGFPHGRQDHSIRSPLANRMTFTTFTAPIDLHQLDKYWTVGSIGSWAILEEVAKVERLARAAGSVAPFVHQRGA
jgi:hypothetical protein